MQPCNHEEADNRLFLHTKDISNKCIKKAIIVTVDIDVIIITLYHYFDSNLEKLWFGIGVGKHKRWLSIHQYAKNLGESISCALPFWNFTGCDTVSSFSGRGKKTGIHGHPTLRLSRHLLRLLHPFFVF